VTLRRPIRRHVSRPIAVVVVLAALFVLSGCWVSSVNGLVEESDFTVHLDPEVVVDQRLAGTWEVTADNCTTTLTVTLKERMYDLASTEQGEKRVDPERPTIVKRISLNWVITFSSMFPPRLMTCVTCVYRFAGFF